MKSPLTPNPSVLAAVTYLLKQPDAAKFRRQHQALVVPVGGPTGRHNFDYTAADNFALLSAQRRANELGEPDPTWIQRKSPRERVDHSFGHRRAS
ncbi:hypothetical protein BH09ACT9_BH09ACT9_35900 [soil metagenome]